MPNVTQPVFAELMNMVVFCKEFKETVLKIFEVFRLPKIEARSKPKLSLFDGGSFDKMYKKLEKLMDEFDKETTKFLSKTRKKSGVTLQEVNETAIDMNHRKKLIKILKDYKGKNSPYKLKAVQAFLCRVGNEKLTYGEFKKYFFEELKPLYGKKENTQESAAEMKLWEEVSGVVNKWPDGDPLDDIKFKKINDIYEKYKKSISKAKKDILDSVMGAVQGSAKRYSKRVPKISRGNNVYKEILGIVENMKKLRAKHPDNPETEAEIEQAFKEMWDSGISKSLSDGWADFHVNDWAGSHRDLTAAIGFYSPHYGRGSQAIDNLYEHIIKGINIFYISKDFYDKMSPDGDDRNFPKIEGSAEEISRKLESLRDNIIQKNTCAYNISNIQAFIEQLKREKF